MLVVFYTLPWLVLYCMYSVALLEYPYEWEPGEGSKILYALQILRGLPLYSSNQTFPMLGNCYPPLYPLVVAPLVAIGGPLLLWGRLVSILSIIGSIVLLACVAKRSTGSWFFSLIAGSCFVYAASISNWYSLARMDSLCCFLQILTAYIILKTNSRKGSFFAGLTAILAIYTKQTALLIVAPLACYYLFQKRWKHCLIYITTIAVTGAILYAGMQVITHGWFYRNLFSENVDRVFFLFRYTNFFGWIFRQYIPVCLVAVIGMIFLFRRQKNSIELWLFLGGLANALLIGANGSGMNYFFVFWAGVSLLFANGCYAISSWISYRFKISKDTGRILLITLMSVIQICWYYSLEDTLFYRHTLYDFIPTKRDLLNGQRLEKYIRSTPAPIFVDRFPSIAMRYDKNDYYVEPALIQELNRAGKWDATELVDMVRSKKFEAIFMFNKSLMPRPFKDAVKEYYKPVRTLSIGTFEIWRNRSMVVYRPQ